MLVYQRVNLVFFIPSISFGQPQRQRHIQMACCAVVCGVISSVKRGVFLHCSPAEKVRRTAVPESESEALMDGPDA